MSHNLSSLSCIIYLQMCMMYVWNGIMQVLLHTTCVTAHTTWHWLHSPHREKMNTRQIKCTSWYGWLPSRLYFPDFDSIIMLWIWIEIDNLIKNPCCIINKKHTILVHANHISQQEILDIKKIKFRQCQSDLHTSICMLS